MDSGPRDEIFFIDCSGSMTDDQIVWCRNVVSERMRGSAANCGAFIFDCREPIELGPFLPGPQAAEALKVYDPAWKGPLVGGGSDAIPAVRHVRQLFQSTNPRLVLLSDGEMPQESLCLFDELITAPYAPCNLVQS